MWLGLGESEQTVLPTKTICSKSIQKELTTLLFGEAVPETAFPCLQRGECRLQALRKELGFSILGLCMVQAGGLGSSSSLAPHPRVLEEVLDLEEKPP